jgi:hypothetical protein
MISIGVIASSSTLGVPNAPVLTITSSTGGSNETAAQYNVSWTVPNNNGNAITGYKTEYNVGQGWYTSENLSASQTSTTVGVDIGGGYSYRVSAINNVGVGLPSNEVGIDFYES